MSKYKIGDKVEIIKDSGGGHSVGSKGKVETVDASCVENLPYNVDVNGVTYWHAEVDLKLIEPKKSKNQRITALEETVAKQDETITKQGEEINELKTIVEGLRKNKFNVEADAETVGQALAETLENVIEFEGAKYRKVERLASKGDVVIFRQNDTDPHYSKTNTPYSVVNYSGHDAEFANHNHKLFDVYARGHNRTPETVDVYERIMPSTVEGTTVQHETLACSAATPKTANELRAEVIEKAKEFYEGMNGDYKYFVEESTGTVIVLDKINKTVNLTSSPPGEVFNEHIQKAITIGRVKGMDVSEFEQAVQPTVAVGQKAYYVNDYDASFSGVRTIKGFNSDGKPLSEEMGGYMDEDRLTILNDTNAIYGGVE